MDPVTAFSLAAGVLQVTSMGLEVISKCRELRRNGSLSQHQITEDVASRLSETVEHLRVSSSQTTSSSLDPDRQLLDVSNNCTETADELLNELGKLKLLQGEAWRIILKKTICSIFKTKKLDTLAARLDEYQKLLNTRILARLNAQDILQSQNLTSISLDVRNLAAGLEQGHRTVADLLPTLSRSFQEHLEQNFVMHEQRVEITRQQDDFKNSLLFPEMFSRQIDIVEAHHETCHWIFSEPNEAFDQSISQWQKGASFAEWLETGRDVYWLSGKPGSGKSTLMKYLSNRFHSSQKYETLPAVTKWANGSDVLVISFFFWALGTPAQHDYAGFLRSSLYQIADAQRDLIPILMEKQDVSCGPLQAWTVARLEATLMHFLLQKPMSISLCFVVDGLDEFGGEYQDNLLETIRLLAQTSRTRVCVSSRPEQIFRQGFANSPQLRLQELNLHDIAKTAHAELHPMLSKISLKDERELTDIINSIAVMSRGIFLWARLVIRDLKEGLMNADDTFELLGRLHRMPKSIEGMYEHMLTKLDQSYLSDAARYFQILMANQPLRASLHFTLLHFKYAAEPVEVASSSDKLAGSELAGLNDACRRLETRILTRCGGLVEIERHRLSRIGDDLLVDSDLPFGLVRYYHCLSISEEETNVSRQLRSVKFIHKSVVEFLQKHPRFSNIPDGSVAVSEATACARLGIMGLLPVMICQIFDPENCTVRLLKFTSQIMAANPLMGCLDLNEAPPRFNIEFWSKLMEHTFHLMHRVNASMSPGCSRYQRSDYAASLDALPPFSKNDVTLPFLIGGETLPFHDTAGFAAFFGCHSYIARQVNFHGADYSRRRYLSYCAILGMDYLTRIEFWSSIGAWNRPYIARFLGLQKILIECLQFEGHFLAPLAAPPQENVSRTTNIDLTWATVLRASMELVIRSTRPLSDRSMASNSQTLARMIDDWTNLAAIFLAEGVDVNHLLYPQMYELDYKGVNSLSLNITVEATPLSTIKHSFFPRRLGKHSAIGTMVSFLSAHGAVDEYSYWSIWCTGDKFTILTDVQAAFMKTIKSWESGNCQEGIERKKPTWSRPKDPDPYFEKLLEELRQKSDSLSTEDPWSED